MLRPFLAMSIVAALLTPYASAQAPTPAPVPAAAGVAPAMPPNPCVKPEFPGKLASSTRAVVFNKELKAYGECVKKYIGDLRNIANAATAAGNSAIDDYNAYQAELKAKIDEANSEAKGESLQ
jgi:hypothetical protein